MGKTWEIVHSSVDNPFKIPGFPTDEPGKVFKLYVSGNVLYAVARNAGC
jgi:hypothetical protein